jgi:hypothetical protein
MRIACKYLTLTFIILFIWFSIEFSGVVLREHYCYELANRIVGKDGNIPVAATQDEIKQGLVYTSWHRREQLTCEANFFAFTPLLDLFRIIYFIASRN